MTEALKKLKEELRMYRGSINRIAEKTSTTPVWITRVLSGKVKNERVVNAAIEVLAEMRVKAQEEAERKQKHDSEIESRILAAI
jgi:hypothetical protein